MQLIPFLIIRDVNDRIICWLCYQRSPIHHLWSQRLQKYLLSTLPKANARNLPRTEPMQEMNQSDGWIYTTCQILITNHDKNFLQDERLFCQPAGIGASKRESGGEKWAGRGRKYTKYTKIKGDCSQKSRMHFSSLYIIRIQLQCHSAMQEMYSCMNILASSWHIIICHMSLRLKLLWYM